MLLLHRKVLRSTMYVFFGNPQTLFAALNHQLDIQSIYRSSLCYDGTFVKCFSWYVFFCTISLEGW